MIIVNITAVNKYTGFNLKIELLYTVVWWSDKSADKERIMRCTFH